MISAGKALAPRGGQDVASPTHTQEIALYCEMAGNDLNAGLFDIERVR